MLQYNTAQVRHSIDFSGHLRILQWCSMPKLTVLLEPHLSALFDAYCEKNGFKKSTLVVRLIRDHLRAEGFATQAQMFGETAGEHREKKRNNNR